MSIRVLEIGPGKLPATGFITSLGYSPDQVAFVDERGDQFGHDSLFPGSAFYTGSFLELIRDGVIDFPANSLVTVIAANSLFSPAREGLSSNDNIGVFFQVAYELLQSGGQLIIEQGYEATARIVEAYVSLRLSRIGFDVRSYRDKNHSVNEQTFVPGSFNLRATK